MNSKFLKTIITIILAVCVLAGAAVPSFAQEQSAVLDLTVIDGRTDPPDVDAPATILMEANTGAILYSRDADTTYYPASITKVMTALLVLENCSLDEVVTFSYRATHELEEGSSGIARTEGEQMTVEECLYAMMIASANEVAQALAEHVGGTIENFSDMMTARAKELGCKNTHFANPSGLNNPDHYTTCYDMALIMRAALSIPKFVEIDSTPTHLVPATNKHDEPLGIAMKHQMLKNGDSHYEYVQCGKTGYTSLAGYTLVTSAKKGDMELICVTLGCKDSESRYSTTKALFEYGFNEFELHDIAENDKDFLTGDAFSGDDSFLGSNLINLSMPEKNYVILPRGVAFPELNSDIFWGGSSDSEDVATITYSYHGTDVGSIRLFIDESESSAYDFLKEDTTQTDNVSEFEDITVEAEAETVTEAPSRTLLIIIIAILSLLVILVAVLIVIRLRQDRRRKRRRQAKHAGRNRSRSGKSRF